jgi:hypothetical protein
MYDADLLSSATVADYLRSVGVIPAGAEVHAEDLEWGVSNVVLKVS